MRALAIGALAAALGGVLAVGVSAHTDRYDSEIEITAGINSDYVYGGLNSPKASCEPKRKVKLYRKRAGDDELIEASHSIGNAGGATWTIEAPGGTFTTGTYYSKARKRDLAPGQAHSHICRGATSDEIPIEP
ncbi:MAG: hypothetical protein ACHQCI_00565 [Solirubrobacterales bacterium]|jgi:hypothetical protein